MKNLKFLLPLLLSFFFLNTKLIGQNAIEKIEKDQTYFVKDYYKDYKKKVVREEGYVKNNKKVGTWISYNRLGQKNSKGQYVNDKKEGLWLYWNLEGKLICKILYRNGRPIRVNQDLTVDTIVYNN
jgi:antitoxin component YwqK of YwqJK toxin-antitoxin module